ncbi:MAG: hypothetical protein QMC80_07800 [Thermoplasmatales archaeon]|nr:hypothetical protein [Thermoplasmatales archaeon]
MGRTIYYNMEGKTAKKEKKKIMGIERKYNRNYRWRGEKLSLSKGFMKTYDSDKDVRRLIMALAEISIEIPEKEWRVNDDEDMINGKIKKGVFNGKINLKILWKSTFGFSKDVRKNTLCFSVTNE